MDIVFPPLSPGQWWRPGALASCATRPSVTSADKVAGSVKADWRRRQFAANAITPVAANFLDAGAFLASDYGIEFSFAATFEEARAVAGNGNRT